MSQVENIQGQVQNYKLQESIEANYKHAKKLKIQHRTKETKCVFDQHVIDIYVDQIEMCCSSRQIKHAFSCPGNKKTKDKNTTKKNTK